MLAVLKKVVLLHRNSQAEIAQLVEHDLAKVGVASSSLVFRSRRSRVKSGFFVSEPKSLSGGIGRHEGLKIPCPLKACRFEPGLGYGEKLHQI